MLIPNLPYQSEVRELIEYNDKIEKEMGGTYLWNFEEAARIILINMKEEAGMNQIYNYQLAHFIALRLKFADEKTIHLMKEALYHNRKYYDTTLDGKHFLYEAMQEGLDYYASLMSLYRISMYGKETNLPIRIKMVDTGTIHNFHHRYLRPSEDGKHIIELSAEEYHKKYGLTHYEKMNKEPTEDEVELFEKRSQIRMEEMKKWEKQIKKPFKKWSQKERDEFIEYVDKIIEERNLK